MKRSVSISQLPFGDTAYGLARESYTGALQKELVLTIVVFGASGDLAKKKTFPAIFALYSRNYLPKDVRIIGYARSQLSNEDLRARLAEYLTGEDTMVHNFLQLITYQQGQYDQPEGFQALQELLLKREGEAAQSNLGPFGRLYYLALPPSVYAQVTQQIRENTTEVTDSKADKESWLRLIIEKPFGHDLESSEELAGQLNALFPETMLYRIDHYLGKEMAQNMVTMRFANTFLYPLWNAENISNVQIVMKENFGTEGRGGYFDKFGIIRDIMQNHLLQIMSLIAMERPVSLHPDDVRDEKVKVLRCITAVKLEETVLGQYVASNGKPGYLDDEGVPKDSNCPTFAACLLHINNPRWAGVPFIMKAGKALNERKAEVRIQFKSAPAFLYGNPDGFRNELVMRLQPGEAIYMKMALKQPGLDETKITMSELDMSYQSRYTDVHIPDAYERLILDAIRGDQQHFVRRDELRAAWAIFTPLLHSIDAGHTSCLPYPYGSRGPKEADELTTRAGFVKNADYVWGQQNRRISFS